MTFPAPRIAQVPTLLVLAGVPLYEAPEQVDHYREALGDRFTIVSVPNGHNVMWESPAETITAIRQFLEPAPLEPAVGGRA